MQSSTLLQGNELPQQNLSELQLRLSACETKEEKKAVYLQLFNLSTLCKLGNEFTKYLDSRGLDISTSSETLNYYALRFFKLIPGIKSENKLFQQANEIIINAIDRCSTIPENTAIIVLSALEELKFLYDTLDQQSSLRPRIENILQTFGLPLDKNAFTTMMNELTTISHDIPYFTESPNPF